ncbi:MAG: hypothetical protein RR891_00150 [Clostridium sp.]
MIVIVLFSEFNSVNAEEINKDVIIKHEYDNSTDILLMPGEDIFLKFEIINNSGHNINITKMDIHNFLIDNFIDIANDDFMIDIKKELIKNLRIGIIQESKILSEGNFLGESLNKQKNLKTNMSLRDNIVIPNNDFEVFSLNLHLNEEARNNIQGLKCNFDIKVYYEIDELQDNINDKLPQAGRLNTGYGLQALGSIIFLIGILLFKFKE